MKRITNYLQFIKFMVEYKPNFHSITTMCKYQGIILDEEFKISSKCKIVRDRNDYAIHFSDSVNNKEVIIEYLHEIGKQSYDYDNIRIRTI